MPITILSFVLGISFSVIVLPIRLSSSCFAITQFGSIRASSTFLGSSSDRNPKIKHSFSVAHIVTHPAGSPRTKSQGWSFLHSLSLGRFILEFSSDFASRCWMWLLDPSYAPPELLLLFLRRISIVIINSFRLNKSSSESPESFRFLSLRDLPSSPSLSPEKISVMKCHVNAISTTLCWPITYTLQALVFIA